MSALSQMYNQSPTPHPRVTYGGGSQQMSNLLKKHPQVTYGSPAASSSGQPTGGGQQKMSSQVAKQAAQPVQSSPSRVGSTISNQSGGPAKKQGFFSRPDVQAGLLQLIMSKMYGQSTKRSFGDALGAAGRYHANQATAQQQAQQQQMEMLKLQTELAKTQAQTEQAKALAQKYGAEAKAIPKELEMDAAQFDAEHALAQKEEERQQRNTQSQIDYRTAMAGQMGEDAGQELKIITEAYDQAAAEAETAAILGQEADFDKDARAAEIANNMRALQGKPPLGTPFTAADATSLLKEFTLEEAQQLAGNPGLIIMPDAKAILGLTE